MDYPELEFPVLPESTKNPTLAIPTWIITFAQPYLEKAFEAGVKYGRELERAPKTVIRS